MIIYGYASWVLGFIDHLLSPKSVRLIQWPRKTGNSADSNTVLTPRELCLPYTLRCNQRPKPFKFFGFHTRAQCKLMQKVQFQPMPPMPPMRALKLAVPHFLSVARNSLAFLLSSSYFPHFICYKGQAPDTPCSPRGTMKGPATRLWVDSAWTRSEVNIKTYLDTPKTSRSSS